MYRLSVLYFCWIQFWKLPETEHTRRVNTEKHLKRVHQIKLAWIVMLCGFVGHTSVSVCYLFSAIYDICLIHVFR